ncbi:MAG: hypothetical protein ACM3VV_06960 [Deltaproteobacteria bacterium]
MNLANIQQWYNLENFHIVRADENTYWELYTRKKHICPNRVPNKKSSVTPPTTAAKPTYYNKKGFASQLTKPKMSNSFELLTGSSVSSIQKQYYEYLSDLIRDHNSKVHGSQSHIISSNNISLIVYYEVPEGKRGKK